MTTEERPERTREGPGQVKRRSRPLIVLGVVLLGTVAPLLFVAAWAAWAEWRYTAPAAAVAAMLVPAGIGVVCIVLGCVPFRARLMVIGILLLGVAGACAAGRAAVRYIRPEEAAVNGFVIAVTGLSGLVCAALGLVRLLSRRKGT